MTAPVRRLGHQNRPWLRESGDAARHVDRAAEPVAGAANGEPVSHACPQLGQPVGVRGVDEFKNRVDQSDGSADTSMTASPMVLMNHTGGSAISRASSASLLARRTRSSGAASRPDG